MINLFFKKKDSNIEIEAVVEGAINDEAKIAADKAYNDNVIGKIKDDLFKKYDTDEQSHFFMHDHSRQYRLLVNEMCKDIAKACDLLRDIPDDK